MSSMVRETDDLLRVAGMRLTQRARLIEAGITTTAELAAHHGPVADLPARTVTALTEQARLQVQDREDDRPPYQIADPQPLTLLPDPDRGDLFFGLRRVIRCGPPTAATGVWEYLFGVLDHNDGFQPLWAHDRAEERRALQKFLKMVRTRRQRYPRMHIYHYAPPRRPRCCGSPAATAWARTTSTTCCATACWSTSTRWCARASGGHRELQPQVAGTLYMGKDRRTGDVTTAADSITQYAWYCRAARRRYRWRRRWHAARADRGVQPL